MWLIDVFSTYLYGLKYVAIILALIILVSGLDDLFIDLVYWSRRIWRALTVYSNNARSDYRELYKLDEKPLIIMVPAWQEHGIVDKMAELAATTLDYENYHIFIGTYPNDAETQKDVDAVCARFPNIHKVVCARPGPTSKADCLNNILDAIMQYEQRANIKFEGFILHDAEDVMSKMELRLFNFLVSRKDMIQLPVYPLERPWHDLVGGHYLDEFAEMHGKDVVVREALVGQVPSAGVGTCFSRRAIHALLEQGDGVAFDVQSLTEDYDIGFRLKTLGMSEIFVRFSVDHPDGPHVRPVQSAIGKSKREASVISVREYFPDTFMTAARQKSRWIIGIVYQGFRSIRWTNNSKLNYFLWRDRKGVITNFASFLAMLLALQIIVLMIYQNVAEDSYHFLSIFEGDWWLKILLTATFLLMCNRIIQRIIFVTSYYGLAQGLLSVPRLICANAINFVANCRALNQTLRSGDIRRIAWAKTDHQYPFLGEPQRARKPLGRILIEQGALTESQLTEALSLPMRGMQIGSFLLIKGLINTEQLAEAVAEQGNVKWERMDGLALSPTMIEKMPAAVALHYAVLPLREENGALVLASESTVDPVSLAAIGRKIGYKVSYVIVPRGQVTVGLRHWYARLATAPARSILDEFVQQGRLTSTEADLIWTEFVSKQILLGDILVSLGHIDAAALRALLLRHEKSSMSLGEYLVDQGVVTQAGLEEALQLQKKLQPSIATLLLQHAEISSRIQTELKKV